MPTACALPSGAGPETVQDSIIESHKVAFEGFVVCSSDLDRLTATARAEAQDGVDAELRNFLGETILSGDCFVDLDPGLGIAALACATLLSDPVVLVRPEGATSRADIELSAERSGVAGRLLIIDTDNLDSLDLPLEGNGLAIVNIGSTSRVAEFAVGARRSLALGDIGVVAWRRGPEDDIRHYENVIAIVRAFGFSPFVLAENEGCLELVPEGMLNGGAVVFALSEAFQARLMGDESHRPCDGQRYRPTRYGADRIRSCATNLFDAIREELYPGLAQDSAVPTAGDLATDELEMLLGRASVVSFDIFDTLITRLAAHPEDVFLHLADEVPFSTLAMVPVSLAKMRRRAEDAARHAAYVTSGSAEVTLQEIHRVLAADLGWHEQHVAAMVDAERRIEKRLCRAHPVLREWFERARNEGKTIWCLSDTYHDAGFLRELLTSCGYVMDSVDVVSSADVRSSKGQGGLFAHVFRMTGVDPASVLHVGDNPHSDMRIPLSHGAQATCHPWAAAKGSDLPQESVTDSIVIGLAAAGVRTGHLLHSFWWRFGYGAAGPVLAGFAGWLHERLRDDNIDRAYFLLRDGEILEEVYRGLSTGHDSPDTALLESSRRAFFLPAIPSGIRALQAQLTASENPRPIGEFLSRLGIDPSSYIAALQRVGFSSADDIVNPQDAVAIRKVQRLFMDSTVMRALLARSADERNLLVAYLRQQRVTEPGRVALIDIGWNATIQKSMTEVLALEHVSADITGYYLGTTRSAHSNGHSGHVNGYLFEASQPADRYESVMSGIQILEFICSSPKGSLRGFRWDSGMAVPVHGVSDWSDTQVAAHGQLRSGILDYVSDLRRAADTVKLGKISAMAAFTRLERVLLNPTAEEAACLGDITHGEGLGSDRARSIAAFPSDEWSATGLMRAMNNAYWRRGLRARREPQALALACIEWMMNEESE